LRLGSHLIGDRLDVVQAPLINHGLVEGVDGVRAVGGDAAKSRGSGRIELQVPEGGRCADGEEHVVGIEVRSRLGSRPRSRLDLFAERIEKS